MFNVEKIRTAFSEIVGFRQPYNPNYAILDSQNLNSESGYYVNDNEFAKIEYLKSCVNYKDITDEQFNDYLRRLVLKSAIDVCNKVFIKPSYIDRNFIYKNANNKAETETLLDGFVGYKINVSSEKNIAFKITRVLLDFQGTGDITLRLYNTSSLNPIQEKTITITSTHQEDVLNWVVDNSSSTYKGEYYLGYNTNGLNVQPYKREYNNSNVMSYITYLGFEKVSVANHNVTTLFNLNDLDGLSEDIGVNPDITVFEDYTDLIIQNTFLFSRAIYLTSVISFLSNYKTTSRSNRDERITEEVVMNVIAEIEGVKTTESDLRIKGLKPELLSEISQIKEQIDRIQNGYFAKGIQTITLS